MALANVYEAAQLGERTLLLFFASRSGLPVADFFIDPLCFIWKSPTRKIPLKQRYKRRRESLLLKVTNKRCILEPTDLQSCARGSFSNSSNKRIICLHEVIHYLEIGSPLLFLIVLRAEVGRGHH